MMIQGRPRAKHPFFQLGHYTCTHAYHTHVVVDGTKILLTVFDLENRNFQITG